MKQLTALLLPVLVLLAVSIRPGVVPLASTDALSDAGNDLEKPFALAELFTSQGCSSCPPADKILAELADRARKGEQIYPLSYHVDYWNYLGWKDPFSDPRFSERQRNYADALGSRVYTPQLVVNGREEMIGSRRNEAERSIERALQRTNSIQLTFEHEIEDRTVSIAYALTGDLPLTTTKVIAVAAQHRAISQVTRGENHGRQLEHVNVVRAFSSVEVTRTGSILLELPADLSDFDLVVFAQQSGHGAVIAADKAEILVKKP